MNKKCIGCGVMMQSEDENALGYTPNLKNDYCKRCFRLKNYGEKKEKEQINEQKILHKVNQNSGLAFFLIDFLNINKKAIHLFNQIKIPKVLIISKSDTLRKEMKLEKIKLWLKKVYHITDQILFISSKSTFKSNNIFKTIEEYHVKTAFIMGITNAGKSTFLNRLLKENNIKKEIVVSNKPNTTLDFIKIKIGEFTIFDTPGFSYENDNLKIITKEMKPISYVLKANTTLVINDTRLYFECENKVTFYGTTSLKREYQKETEKYSLNIPKNNDIVLPGIGFLNVKEECLVLANKKDLEIRLDISEVSYE